jgi:hypothetical protein
MMLVRKDLAIILGLNEIACLVILLQFFVTTKLSSSCPSILVQFSMRSIIVGLARSYLPLFQVLVQRLRAPEATAYEKAVKTHFPLHIFGDPGKMD